MNIRQINAVARRQARRLLSHHLSLTLLLLASAGFVTAQSEKVKIAFSDDAVLYEGVLDLGTGELTAKLHNSDTGAFLAERAVKLEAATRQNLIIYSGRIPVPRDSKTATPHYHNVRLAFRVEGQEVSFANCPADECYTGKVFGVVASGPPDFLRGVAYRLAWEAADTNYEALLIINSEGSAIMRVRYLNQSNNSIITVQMDMKYKRIPLKDENIRYVDALLGATPIDTYTKEKASNYNADNLFFVAQPEGGLAVLNIDDGGQKVAVEAQRLNRDELQRLLKRFN